MKIIQIINEGGWSSTATQDTTITPSTVKTVLPYVDRFINDLNHWLESNNIPPVKMGEPLGSSAYYQRDSEDTEYGDIDLQTIAPDIPGKNAGQVGRYYNDLIDQFINTSHPTYIHKESKKFDGHPVFKVNNDYVQVDFVWATEQFANWSRYRMTPAHGIKGAVHGTMFAVFGELMNMSVQGNGAQIKIVDGKSAPFGKTRKYDSLEVLTSDIESFGLDIARWLHKKMDIAEPLQLSDLLKTNPGLQTKEISSEQLASVIKGVALTFELNNMYGKFSLENYNNADDFINAFVAAFSVKMEAAASSGKFDKAETPAAKAKANATKQKLLNGIGFITQLMKS